MKLLLVDALLSAALFPILWRARNDLRGWPAVTPADLPGDADAPVVTVLVPARNEERSVERCLRSLLDQRYPRDRLRVVAVDDRSTDATPRILARIAAEDDRLTVLQGAPLPAGWMGKCWALQQAAEHADPRSRYLLFTDADTVHHPGMLAGTVRFAEEHQVDLLSLAPDQELGSAAERLFLPTIWALAMAANGTLAEVNDPAKPRAAKALGQFILFRAQVYRAIGGHAAVKGEIVEDFALARLVKPRGYRLLFADGRAVVRTRMYRSAREIWQGYTKNTFDEARRNVGGALGGLLGLPALAFGPYALLLVGLRRLLRGGGRPADAALLVQAALQSAGLLVFGRVSAGMWKLPPRYGLAQPLAVLFLWGILANSTWRNLSGRGVVWKGRTYEWPARPSEAPAPGGR